MSPSERAALRIEETKPNAWREAIIVGLSGLAVFMAGGVVFGFSSLYPVLYSEGVYEDVCGNDDCKRTESCCAAQRLWLTLVASCSLFAADGVMVIYGELNDRSGPVTCLLWGSCLACTGFMGLALGTAIDKDGLFFAGLLALGLGGPGIFMGALAFGSAEPRIEPTVTAATAAMWDSSSVVFLIFATAYDHFSFPAFIAIWAVVSLVVSFLVMALLLRSLRTAKRLRQRNDEIDRRKRIAEERSLSQSTVGEESVLSEENPISMWRLLIRRDTVGLVGFMALYNLKSAFYIETMSDQIRTSLNISNQRARMLDLTFNLAFPIGGFATSLGSAALLQKFHNRDDIVFLVVAVAANIFSLLQLAPFETTQYAAACIFGPARTLQWAAYFHLFCNPDGRYPENVGGRLIGYGNLAIAIVGDGIPYALTAFVDADALSWSRALRYSIIHSLLALAILVSSIFFYLLLVSEYRRRSSCPDTSYHSLPGPPPPPPRDDDDEDLDAAVL